MFLLDPVNSVTSIEFYRKVAARPLGKTILYLAYLGLLIAAATTGSAKMSLDPVIDETFSWLSTAMPPLTFADGRLTSGLLAPLRLVHPRYAEGAFIVDTNRAEPVTPQMLEEQKVLAYLTGTTLYVRSPQRDKMEVYDFSKAAQPKAVVLDAGFYHEAGAVIKRWLFPLMFLGTFCFYLLWLHFTTTAGSIIALAANVSLGGALGYRSLFNIAAHAQTLSVLLQATLLLLSAAIPGFFWLGLLINSVYIWLAVKRSLEPQAAPPAV